jgi:hypothetical protein
MLGPEHSNQAWQGPLIFRETVPLDWQKISKNILGDNFSYFDAFIYLKGTG